LVAEKAKLDARVLQLQRMLEDTHAEISTECRKVDDAKSAVAALRVQLTAVEADKAGLGPRALQLACKVFGDAVTGPYSRALALGIKACELRTRGRTERSLDKLREALAAARAIGTEDCLVTSFLTVAVAERTSGLLALSLERAAGTPQRLSVAADQLRKLVDTLIGAAAVARRRRAAGTPQPAEQAWYFSYHGLASGMFTAKGMSHFYDAFALYAEHLRSAASSIDSETTVFAACEALFILYAATNSAVFSEIELSSRLDAVCDLVDEAVALAGGRCAASQRVEDTNRDTSSGYSGAMKGHLHNGIEVWRQQSSTAAHAERLEGALKQLSLHGRAWLSADEQALLDKEAEDLNAKQVAARAAATAPKLLRCCALASCDAKEAHVWHFNRCAICKVVAYCCKEHQRTDWPAHKATCEAPPTKAAAPAAMSLQLRRCSCGAKEAHAFQFSLCASCKTVVYCSKTCQLSDWPSHKKACKAARKAVAAEGAAAGNAA